MMIFTDLLDRKLKRGLIVNTLTGKFKAEYNMTNELYIEIFGKQC